MADGYVEEIAEQPGVIAALAGAFEADHAADLAGVPALLRSGKIERIVLTGMGGSLHSLYPMLLELGRQCPLPASLWDSSELVQQGLAIIDERTLVVAVSQSGESGEVVRLCEQSRRPALAIAVTNGGGNTLAAWADIGVRTGAGPERTASTKTYTAGPASLTLVTEALLGRPIAPQAEALRAAAAAIDRSLTAWTATADELTAFLGAEAPISYVGRGANLATASMAALLTAEASKLSCTALSGGQFRHGPIELVREGFRCVIFASPDAETAKLDRRIAETVVDLGGRCAWVSAGGSPAEARPGEFVVDLPPCDPSCLPILNIVPLQLLQVPLATARGFVPAQFLNASKVTTGQ
jgi:glucosamine--fructose-6-phosphate aminotransferase (isomerizing)